LARSSTLACQPIALSSRDSPARAAERRQRATRLSAESTLVFFEAPHRIAEALLTAAQRWR
jgi:16S rRNA C1402 (ribose-2'-O) methylase RsmI